MITHYCRLAWRSLMRSKLFSAINIAGLAIGLSCCMLIVIYIWRQLSFDTALPNVHRLYQVGGIFITDGKEERFPCSPAITAANLRQDFPEIDQTARMLTFSFFGEYKTLLQVVRPDGEVNSFYEPAGSAADNSFLTLFGYRLQEGDLTTALTQPNSVVVSADLAKRLFGRAPALGKTIHISSSLNGVHDCRVTGVFSPGERPSHVDAGFILSFYGGSIEERMKRDGTNMAFDNMYTTYVLLRPGVDPHPLEARFPAFIEKYAGRDLRQSGFGRKDFLLPVTDIHLHADMMEMTPSGNPVYLYILGSIAAFVLVLAGINFMNLSTARSHRRAAEVGIRKVLGSTRYSLMARFLGESVLMTAIAFVIALGILAVFLPVFEKIAGQSLLLYPVAYVRVLGFFLVLSLLTGLLAGSYPAFYLSAFQPGAVLKGRFAHSLGAIALRKGLVVFQFVISVILIIVTVVIAGQLRFLRSADLGFAKDRQIVIPLQSQLARDSYASFKMQLAADPRILSVGAGSYYPGIVNAAGDNFHKEGQNVSAGQMLRINHVDEDFLRTLGFRVVAGRMFSREYVATDTLGHVIINEEAVRKIGFSSPQDAVGRKLISVYKGEHHADEIVGVVKDFHYESLHSAITPFVFYLNNSSAWHYAVVHAGAGDIGSILSSLENAWRRLDPGEPFTYSLLDDDFQRNYDSDRRLSGIVNGFTVVAILISCMGLFGLTSFSAEQRRKELSIRKVLGAGVSSLVALLSLGFIRLVLLAIVIASPIAWLIMHRWLQDFTVRIDIGWPVFVFTAAGVLAIAFLTISALVVRAARTNPVKNLKTE